MSRKKYLLLGIALLIGCGAYFIYSNVLYKEARNITEEKASFQVSATELIDEYRLDLSKADLKYLNKTIEVTGEVTDISDSILTLGPSVFCAFDKKVGTENLNKKIKVKGRCIGFDELMEEVKLDQCSIIQ